MEEEKREGFVSTDLAVEGAGVGDVLLGEIGIHWDVF